MSAMFILIPLGVIILAGIVYLAISKRSSSTTRIVALCALGLMIVTVIVCLFIIFGMGTAGKTKLPVYSETPGTPPPGPPVTQLLIFAIFMVVLFVVVLILSLRERKRHKKEADKKNGWN